MEKSYFPSLGNRRQIRRVRFLEMHRNYLGKWSTTCTMLRRPRGATIASLSTLLSLSLVGVDEIWVDALHNWARRPEGSSIRDVRDERHTDRGEGSSRGVPRLSGSFHSPLLLQYVADIDRIPKVLEWHRARNPCLFNEIFQVLASFITECLR